MTEAPLPPPARRELIPGLLLVLLAWLAFAPVWRADFIWDDDEFLTQNPLIHAPDGLSRFWFSTRAPDYFPLTSSTLWIEWRLWGMNALGYHLVNLLLHTLSALLLWGVLRRLAIPGAWLAAALFAVHPVNVESVAWITERKNTLCFFFFSASLLAFLRFEDDGRRRFYVLSLAAFLLALLAKTAVVALPAVLLLFAWWRRRRIDLRDVVRSLPFFAVALALAGVTLWFQSERAIGTDLVRDDGFFSRLAGAGWAAWFYLSKAWLPLGLSFVYPRWTIDAANLLSYLPGLAFLGGLAAAWRWKAARPAAFAFTFFLLMLFPVLGFFNIYFMKYSLVADHWQYFALPGPLALAAAAIARLGERVRHQAVRVLVAAVLLLTLSALTFSACLDYRDPETLWKATLARNPGCSMAHNNLGLYCLERGRSEEALDHVTRALALDPGNAKAHNNLGNLHGAQGRTEEAEADFRRAIARSPKYASPHNGLGILLFQGGRTDDAVEAFEEAVRLEPEFAEAHNNLGNALMRRGQLEAAAAHYERASLLQRDNANFEFNRSLALSRLGRHAEALAAATRAAELRPDGAAIHEKLGQVHLAMGRVDLAIPAFQKALRLDPAKPGPLAQLNAMAWAWATAADPRRRFPAQALSLASETLRATRHATPELLATLAAALAANGRFAEAIDVALRARQQAAQASETRWINALDAHLSRYRQATALFIDQ